MQPPVPKSEKKEEKRLATMANGGAAVVTIFSQGACHIAVPRDTVCNLGDTGEFTKRSMLKLSGQGQHVFVPQRITDAPMVAVLDEYPDEANGVAVSLILGTPPVQTNSTKVFISGFLLVHHLFCAERLCVTDAMVDVFARIIREDVSVDDDEYVYADVHGKDILVDLLLCIVLRTTPEASRALWSTAVSRFVDILEQYHPHHLQSLVEYGMEPSCLLMNRQVLLKAREVHQDLRVSGSEVDCLLDRVTFRGYSSVRCNVDVVGTAHDDSVVYRLTIADFIDILFEMVDVDLSTVNVRYENRWWNTKVLKELRGSETISTEGNIIMFGHSNNNLIEIGDARTQPPILIMVSGKIVGFTHSRFTLGHVREALGLTQREAHELTLAAFDEDNWYAFNKPNFVFSVRLMEDFTVEHSPGGKVHFDESRAVLAVPTAINFSYNVVVEPRVGPLLRSTVHPDVIGAPGCDAVDVYVGKGLTHSEYLGVLGRGTSLRLDYYEAGHTLRYFESSQRVLADNSIVSVGGRDFSTTLDTYEDLLRLHNKFSHNYTATDVELGETDIGVRFAHELTFVALRAVYMMHSPESMRQRAQELRWDTISQANTLLRDAPASVPDNFEVILNSHSRKGRTRKRRRVVKIIRGVREAWEYTLRRLGECPGETTIPPDLVKIGEKVASYFV